MVEGEREQGIAKAADGGGISSLQMFNASISTPIMWVSPTCAPPKHGLRRGCVRRSIQGDAKEEGSREGKRPRIEPRRVSFSFLSITRNYMRTDVHTTHKDTGPTENEGWQDIQCIRKIESEIEEDVVCTYDRLSETKQKDGPSITSLIVNNLVKGVVERKVLETKKVLECIQDTAIRAKEMYDPRPDQDKAPFDRDNDPCWDVSDKTGSSSDRYVSCALLQSLASRMREMIEAIQTQGKVGLLPSQARLDKSFVAPLQFLIMHLETVLSAGGGNHQEMQALCPPHISLHNNSNILNC
ncbi:hypothetical protein GUITHDRAFT_119808 [Guillardia theta CCMP2712]|uniref:Uncharacterized protein n=2 Tax=Guillardia theta TaxID=55529 RepID=L1ICP7_GUITC|nr:hypothetical protein GUITHDRAFT_119808 [Guillardia theta CCMP2712]EKX34008.1 hypothetical protein GUITHDRAFT_119808 [Guillardia theta CCMP2712]|eukprot:XP_005820988.1 hypothetical protein GUITHDRAFT_119808 [Guillardia theta CCMP2712]